MYCSNYKVAAAKPIAVKCSFEQRFANRMSSINPFTAKVNYADM